MFKGFHMFSIPQHEGIQFPLMHLTNCKVFRELSSEHKAGYLRSKMTAYYAPPSSTGRKNVTLRSSAKLPPCVG